MPQWESLNEELKTVSTAIEQARSSTALKKVLQNVLAFGNYLNGTTARGGAYGFKLSDLSKLVQVKSGDSKTTLLHYLARFMTGKEDGAIADLKNQLNALPEAKDVALADKKAELAKLASSFKLAQSFAEKHALQRRASMESTDGTSEPEDPIVKMLETFCDEAAGKLKQLEEEEKSTEQMIKDLCKWFAEKPTATTNELFGPLSDFVKSLEKAHQDNKREEEAEKRKKAAATRPGVGGPGGPGKFGGRPMPGMALPGMGGGDNSMMLEMQLKLARRTEKAAAASGAGGGASTLQQQALMAQKQATVSGKHRDGGLMQDLAEGAATGALFAQRRAMARAQGSGS
jgi:hypothetical protein